jgi:hypothetical protein
METKYTWPVGVDQLEQAYASILLDAGPGRKVGLEVYGR